MKRYLASALALASVMVTATPAAAALPSVRFHVSFNGHPILFDVEPEIVNGRTYVPFRAIFEKMGAEVSFDNGTVTASRGNSTVNLTIGSTSASVNGSSTTLAAAPYIKDDRTLVPLRFVGEAFGASVSYDQVSDRGTVHKIDIADPNWPKRGGTLNLAMWNKPEGNFNPITVADTYGTNITGLLYDGLWRYDERLTPIPAMAESWEWDETNTQLTFHLRKGIKFHNGRELTAKDVLYTYRAIWHPKYIGPRNSGFDDVLGWEEYTNGKGYGSADSFESGLVTVEQMPGFYAPDDYTVVFKLKQPNAPFIFNVAFGIMDSEAYANVPVNKFGTAQDPNNIYPNGTGAFRMGDYAEGDYAIMNANPTYWSGKPYVDRVIWRIVAPDVTVGEVQLGRIDFAEFSPPELSTYQAMSNINITEYPDLLFQMMMFNTVDTPLADKSVRHAVSYGIDRQSIITNLMKDHGSTMYGPVHPLTWAYTDEIEKYPYNPAKAKELLDAAGWTVGSDGIRVKNGERLHLRLIYPNVGNPVRQATAPVVQQWMKDIGVEVELVGYDWPTINTKVFEEYDFDMFFIGFSLGNSDPDPTGLWDKSAIAPGAFNATQWWTEKSEELIKKGKATGDIETRMGIYAEWQKLFAEEAPAYIFYAVNTLIANNTRLQNFKPGPQGSLWNIEEIWLSN